jgi:hypothetical protein
VPSEGLRIEKGVWRKSGRGGRNEAYAVTGLEHNPKSEIRVAVAKKKAVMNVNDFIRWLFRLEKRSKIRQGTGLSPPREEQVLYYTGFGSSHSDDDKECRPHDWLRQMEAEAPEMVFQSILWPDASKPSKAIDEAMALKLTDYLTSKTGSPSAPGSHAKGFPALNKMLVDNDTKIREQITSAFEAVSRGLSGAPQPNGDGWGFRPSPEKETEGDQDQPIYTIDIEEEQEQAEEQEQGPSSSRQRIRRKRSPAPTSETRTCSKKQRKDADSSPRPSPPPSGARANSTEDTAREPASGPQQAPPAASNKKEEEERMLRLFERAHPDVQFRILETYTRKDKA